MIRERLINAQQANTALNSAYRALKPYLLSGHVYELHIKPETRSTAQNRLMWALLACLSAQVNWYGNRLTKEEWKDVVSASIKRQKVYPGIDGGFVICGQSTSKMTVAEMNDVIEATLAFGAQQGVRFPAPEYEEAV